MKSIKDKLSHSLYRNADESSHLVDKEQECMKRFREKEAEQQVKEERLRAVERDLMDKENRLSHDRT